MPKYTAEPGATILGSNIIATVDALEVYASTGYGILAENGITDIQPDGWYPMQPFCDFLEAIDTKVGASVYYIIGKKVFTIDSLLVLGALPLVDKVKVKLPDQYQVQITHILEKTRHQEGQPTSPLELSDLGIGKGPARFLCMLYERAIFRRYFMAGI